MREKLDARRGHETFEFQWSGIALTVGVGRYDDGRLAEVFLRVAKDGTQIDAMARELAVLTSIALQHGVSVAALIDDLPVGDDGLPVGPVGQLLAMIAETDALDQARMGYEQPGEVVT